MAFCYSSLILVTVPGLAEPAENHLAQVAPDFTYAQKFVRTKGQKRAILLIHGLPLQMNPDILDRLPKAVRDRIAPAENGYRGGGGGGQADRASRHRADQIRAIDRLRDRTGFHVLMGCASDRVSYEASQYAQGLLTYALLQGMRGAKLREGEYVDVMDLFQYAADQVPQLARNIGGIQKPLVLAPRGTSFDIGRLKDEDKKLIPLTLVRPLLLRPVLQNADENILEDDLGLMVRLRKRLTEESFASARGKANPAAVYVDADDMPGAIRPAGKYTVQGKKVSVRLLLRQNGQTVATLQVEGSRDELDALAERLATAILGKLKMP